MIKFLLKIFVGLSACICAANAADNYEANWESLNQHEAPGWLMDAKMGIQYVGAPGGLNDRDYFDWSRSAQRVRELGFEESPEDLREHIAEFEGFQKRPYAFVQNKVENLDEVFEAYKHTGAKFMVSMVLAAFPGTEGLKMTRPEVESARHSGFHVGVHYNFLRRDRVPSIGDPGYVEYYQKQIKDAVVASEADFIFFDGSQLTPSDYLKSHELLAWYYNWADANGKEVWVNEDLGKSKHEDWDYGDVVDLEGFTMDAVPTKAWINWDTLRNEWNCWIGSTGIHLKEGTKWEWEYRKTEDVLQVFVHNVSKGGVWLVQMVNTKKAWNIMNEIGDWLAINGEAIYETRPLLAPQPDASHFPTNPQVHATKESGKYWWTKYLYTVEKSKEEGPFYFTKKGKTVYAIHWGEPGKKLVIPGVTAKPGSSIRMLGVDKDLNWNQNGGNIVISNVPNMVSDYACSFAITVK